LTNPEFQHLLAGVSRSFFLSLRLLPAAVRPSLSLAYALARASDTISDSSDVPAEKRISALRSLPDVLPTERFDVPVAAEQALLDQLPALLARLAASPDRELIETTWKTIRDGQIFDIERFPSPSPLSPAELERYVYLVAGCVGEFWTDLCLARLPDPFQSPATEMRVLGREFGEALQRVNILRDRASDAAQGRIYVSPDDVQAEISRARAGLAAGTAYAAATRSRLLRASVALPADLGRQTLDLLANSPSTPRVRVTRPRVWLALLRAVLARRREF